jgi:imidazoleglycerol phosphate synthase glutamine amidotransferase subunit HisH
MKWPNEQQFDDSEQSKWLYFVHSVYGVDLNSDKAQQMKNLLRCFQSIYEILKVTDYT